MIAKLIDHDDYTNIPGVNWSTLRLLLVSPLWLRYCAEHPPEDSAAKLLGRAIHCCALEPERWATDYAVATEPRPTKPRNPGPRAKPATRQSYDAAMDVYAEEAAAWDAANVDTLTAAQRALAERCAASIQVHPRAVEVLQHTRREEPFTWVDDETGLPCKARGDAIATDHIADLKSTRRQTLRAFFRDASELLYHGQLAYYHDGAVAAGRLSVVATRPYMVAIQTVPPYDCAVVRLSAVDLAAGRALYRSLLRQYAGCLASDWWPGIAPEIVESELPPWAAGMAMSPGDGEEDW